LIKDAIIHDGFKLRYYIEGKGTPVAVKDKFKKLKIYVFNKSGHTPPLEEPTIFTERLLKFISEG
jgi:hypothetical protein